MFRFLVSIVVAAVPLPVLAQPGPLLEATVTDAATGLPIQEFRFLPGTPYRGFSREQRDPIAVWQPHLIKLGVDGKFEWSRQRSYEEFRLRIEADGYQATETKWFQRDELTETKQIRIDLQPDPGVEGKLLTPDNQAASGATIGIALPNRRITLENGQIKDADREPPLKLSDQWRRPVVIRTNERGEFRLPTEMSAAVLVAFVHESGYLQVPAAELRAREVLQLEPWGTIEGRVLWKDKVGDGETLSLIISREQIYPEMVYLSLQAVSNERGRFMFDKLPPGHAQLSRHLKKSESNGGKHDYMFPIMHVNIQPGEPTTVTVGGRGKTIRGKLTGLDSYQGISVSLAPEAPSMSGFIDVENSIWAGFGALRKSSLAPLVFREPIDVNEDGTFVFEHVIPEDYQIFVRSDDKSVYKVHNVRMRSETDEEERSVEIPMVKQRLPKP